MDSLGTRDLRHLTSEQSGPCVSIYMPTHMAGEDGQQDPVRLKNLLQSAEQQLSQTWLRPADSRRLLQEARDLPTDPGFWEARSHGLAIFITPEAFCSYRLPHSFRELAVVGKRYYVRPLLPLIDGGERFLILSLSQHRARLFSGSRCELTELKVEGLPAGMKEALNYTDVEGRSQVHSATQGSLGRQGAVFHGQGGQTSTRKEDIATYFRLIDVALQGVLRDEHSPLLLAGVAYLLPMYREINRYPHLASQELVGNYDHLTEHQLHQRAWPLVEPLYEQARVDAARRYQQLSGTLRTSADILQVVPAAHDGRVDTLFVDTQAHQWGTFQGDTAEVELHLAFQAGDEDLLDLAALETLAHRGTVYAVAADQLPDRAPVAALYRW